MSERLTFTLALVVALLPVQYSSAKTRPSQGMTAAQMKLLPPACQARLRGDAEEQRKWGEALGAQNYLHLHHFCYGLIAMNDAKLVFDKRQRKYLYQRAASEFNYVIGTWPTSFALRDEAVKLKAISESYMRLP